MLLGTYAAGAHAAPAGVRLLEGTVGSVRFEITVPDSRITPLPADSTLQELSLDGYAPAGAAGTPGLPSRLVLVAIPPSGEVRVQANSVEASVRENVMLAPVPELVKDADGVSARYRPSAEAYAARGSQAPERARLEGIGWLRNQRVARIEVRPADYDPAARRLTLSRRIEIQVSVAPTAPVETPAERPDPFERVYLRLLVNYEQGRQWRRPAAAAGAGLIPGARVLGPAGIATGDTVYAGRQWVKLAISEPGMYKLDYGTVRNLRPFLGATVRTDDLRLFTWRSPLPVLPEQDYCDACAFHEVPISAVDGGDGLFDNNSDYFYFFGLGPSDWANIYDPAKPDTTFFNHPYETRNYYYLTVSDSRKPIAGPPLRIPVTTADIDTTTAPLQASTFPERLHYEQSNEYFPDSPPVPTGTSNASGTVDSLSWQKWFWKSLGPGQTYQVSMDLPGVDLSQPTQPRVRARVWGLVSTGDQCGFVTNALVMSLNGVSFPEARWYAKGSFTLDATLQAPQTSGNTLQLSLPSYFFNQCSRVGLASVDAFYPRKLEPVNDSLTFVADSTLQRTVYRIGPFTSPVPPRLFDVSDSFSPTEVVGFNYQALDASHFQLAFVSDGMARHRYRVVPDTRIPRLLGTRVFEAPRSSLTDLRGLKADYVVIYYDAFGAAAESLATWRRLHLPLPGVSAPYDTATVPISALFDQFSGGRTDPMAIRNFLRAVFLRQGAGRKVSFVTLLGDASYDYKNFLLKAPPGQPGCLLPTYENGYDAPVLGGHQFTTDDWLLNVDDADRILPDFFGGRIPVSDPATAMDVVRNKVLLYERQAPYGEYRNQVMLIADDNQQCLKADPIGWGHLLQTATLDAQHTPRHVDREYVYLHTYPNGAASCSKPAAKAEIKRNIQDGVAIFNYIGHGSPFQLSDEAVFIETDVGTLTNAPRYPLFVAASCDVGLFNDPTTTSLGEKLVTTPGGGAIAVVSSTQLALSTVNATLNGFIYDQLFDRNPASGGQFHTSIAEALLTAKEMGAGFGGITNDMKYQLMGDAGTRLNLPRLWVELAFQDTLGNPVSQMTRGQSVVFSGRLLDAPGGNPVALSGTASVLIEDSPPIVEPPGCSNCGVDFYYRAGPIYRADVAVVAGAMQGRFVVPLEAREGPLARARAYVTGRVLGEAVDTDAVGSQATLVAAGVAPAGDNEGPRIALSFSGGALEVRPDAVLHVDLFDPSGILITDHTPQNGIIVTLDGSSTSRVDITPSFRYAANSYQGGRATFPLPGLSAGVHVVQVSAADNLASGFNAGAHRSTATLQFRVLENPKLNVARAYLFPDPTTSKGPGRGGHFVVDAPGDTLNVQLRIYTVSGKLIRTLQSFGGYNQVQLGWDGLDDERAPLANGVYLFKVNVNARQPDGQSSASEHAIAQGRFVVVNP